jgi:regulator of replication initiation timing
LLVRCLVAQLESERNERQREVEELKLKLQQIENSNQILTTTNSQLDAALKKQKEDSELYIQKYVKYSF